MVGAEYWFTCLCAMQGDPPGEYSEEIDVAYVGKGRVSQAAIKRAAQAHLDSDYEPGMKVRKIERNFGMRL